MRRGRGLGRALAAVALAGATADGTLPAREAAAQRGARIGPTAPEVIGAPWLNSEPLSLAGLRGRVVLVEFWTYG